jgi:hypothetical protein
MVHPLSGAKTRQLGKFMKQITETSDSNKQAYTQPALVELGDLKTDTLAGATVTTNDGTSA